MSPTEVLMSQTCEITRPFVNPPHVAAFILTDTRFRIISERIHAEEIM